MPPPGAMKGPAINRALQMFKHSVKSPCGTETMRQFAAGPSVPRHRSFGFPRCRRPLRAGPLVPPRAMGLGCVSALRCAPTKSTVASASRACTRLRCARPRRQCVSLGVARRREKNSASVGALAGLFSTGCAPPCETRAQPRAITASRGRARRHQVICSAPRRDSATVTPAGRLRAAAT